MRKLILLWGVALMLMGSVQAQKLTYLETNKKGYKEYRNVKDGSVLIEIPAGNFTMGSTVYELGNFLGNDEKPLHTVYLDKYYIQAVDLNAKSV